MKIYMCQVVDNVLPVWFVVGARVDDQTSVTPDGCLEAASL